MPLLHWQVQKIEHNKICYVGLAVNIPYLLAHLRHATKTLWGD